MTKPKKSKPNPIEEAIGDRAKPKSPKEILRGYPVPEEQIPQNPSEIADVPSPLEMLNLEELNRQTEERLQDQYPESQPATIVTPKSSIPASKPDPQPVTKTSSEESPPQKIETTKTFPPQALEHLKPAEDVELTALKKYILEDGFVLSTVAFHIVTLCAQPMVTPSTTTWKFRDRAKIPDMVLALLNQPGYIDGVWPSLKIVMGSNIGNSAWSAGICTTIAFFDVIRILPALKELQNDS